MTPGADAAPPIVSGGEASRFGDVTLSVRMRTGLALPLIAAPMFLVSGPDLLVACCEAGTIGSMPAFNARTSAILDQWLADIAARLRRAPDAAPFALNLIVHSSNTRLDEDLDLCVSHRIPIVIASAGSPKRVVEKIKPYGGLVICDAATVNHARRAAAVGADALLLLCAGAGGNTGWISPFAFVSEVRKFFDGPIILAGAISRGEHVRAAELIGADMVAVGTPFIAATESLAADEYRDMLIASGADDIILTDALTGIPANMLRQSLERSGFTKSDDHKGFDMKREGDTLRAWRDVWSAGHGVGDIVKKEPAAAIIERFASYYTGTRDRGI